MKQTLYLIKGNQRVELDTGGGNITMQYCNPLFAGLNKVKFSRSFSFSLPLTQRNIQAFDLFGEMGYKGESYGKMFDAEYWLEGMPAITGARLYILSLSNNAYQCTLIVADSAILESLKDGGLKLRDIGKPTDWTDWTEDCFKTGNNAVYFNTDNAVCYPLFDAGMPCITTAGTIRKANFDDVQNVAIAPPPCVQVSAILNRLAEMGIDWRSYFFTYNGDLPARLEDYDIDKDGRDNMMTFGVIPLVTTAVSQERGAQKWANQYRNPYSPDYQDDYWDDIHNQTKDWGDAKFELRIVVFELNPQYATLSNYKVQRGGHVIIQVKDLRLPIETANNIEDIAVVLLAQNENGDYFTASVLHELWGNDTDTERVYDETFEVRDIAERGGGRVSIGLQIVCLVPGMQIILPNVTITESVFYDEGYCTHPIYWPDCLPDVSVWDFLKYILSMYRAVPDARPNKILRYSVLKKNLDAGSLTNWSGKIVRGNGWQQYDQYALSIDGLAQKNYYLMANEESDKEDGGGYEVVKCRYDSENPWVEKSAEQFKGAFYPAFKIRDNDQFQKTGNTIDFWKPSGGNYVAERGDTKPAIGRVTIRRTEDGNKPFIGLQIANLPADLWDDTLGKWLKKPEVIKAKFNLDLMDLQDAQKWETPIYIEELRGIFAIVKIDFKAGDAADVELLKIR